MFIKIRPVPKQAFLLHCPAEIIKCFCNCPLDVVHGHIETTAEVSAGKLRGMEPVLHLSVKIIARLRKKRQLLATRRGFKLLKKIKLSLLNYLKKRIETKQWHERVCVVNVGRLHVQKSSQPRKHILFGITGHNHVRRHSERSDRFARQKQFRVRRRRNFHSFKFEF